MVGWRLVRRIVLLGVAAGLGGTLAVAYPCRDAAGLLLLFALFLWMLGHDSPYYWSDAWDDGEHMGGPEAWVAHRVLPYYLSFTLSFGAVAHILWLSGAHEPSCA
jgi:hypothetical protein